MSCVFVSIATASHLSQAQLALASVRSSGGSVRRVIYLFGAPPGLSCSDPGLELRYAEQHMDAALFRYLVRRYTAPEVCFALKPFVMKQLLGEGAQQVHYIDADIRFHADAGITEAVLADGDLLLTPHYLHPYPLDDRRPRVLTLLRSGVFNGGYVGVRNTPQGLAFLDWWAENLARECENDPRQGTCGDQRWLDLVPALFPGCLIWRHPGANVAYWNLHERVITHSEDGYRSNGELLLFFHFSGFSSDSPLDISRYQDRIRPADDSALRSILLDHAREFASLEVSGKIPPYRYRRWWHGERPPIPAIRRWLRSRERR